MASNNFTYTQTKLSDTSYRLSVLPTQENNDYDDLITSGTVTDGLTSKNFTLVHWGVPYINQFGSSPNVSAAGGRLLYNVYTHYPFVFRSVPTWVHISDNLGHEIQEGQTIPESSAMTNGYLTTYYVDVDANEGHSRDTYGTFNMGHYIGPDYTTLGDRVSWIVIEQEAGEETPEYIYFNPTAITFDATANTNDTKQVVVNSSSRWNGGLVLYDTNKFTISPNNGQSGETTVTITYVGDYLPATGYRTQLNIYAIDGTSGMSITKASAATPVEEDYIIVSPRSFSLSSASTQGNSFSVSANTLWSATVEDPDWIDLETLYGPSGYTSGLSFDTDANTGSTRQGYINFSAGTAVDSITVEQQAAFVPDTIETNVTIIGPASSAGTQEYPYTFRVRSTADWTIPRYPSWVTISPLTGSASTAYTYVYISVSSNPGPSRSDYIQITAGTATPKVLNISQYANSNYIVISPTAETFTSGLTRAGYLNVSASTDWRIVSKPSWVTFRSTTAMTSQTLSAGTSGDTTVWLSVSENTGDTRSGSAAFALENTSYTGIWTATQEAAGTSEGTLHVTPEDDITDIASTGGVYSILAENGDVEDWLISYSDDWLQLYYDAQCTNPVEYIFAGQEVYLFLKVNQTDINRSGAVIFTGQATGIDITLDIEQSAE